MSVVSIALLKFDLFDLIRLPPWIRNLSFKIYYTTMRRLIAKFSKDKKS